MVQFNHCVVPGLRKRLKSMVESYRRTYKITDLQHFPFLLKMLNLSSLVLLLISLVSTSGNDGLQQSSPFQIEPKPTASALLAGGDEQDQYFEQDAAVEKIGQIFFPEFYVDGAIRSPPSIEVQFFADEDPVTFHKTSDLIDDQSYYWYGEAGDKSLNLLATAGSDGQTVIG